MSETRPTSVRPPVVPAQPGDLDSRQRTHLLSILDRQSALPSLVRLRQWARLALAPRPGETAVDIGSGTGEETQALSAIVGPLGEVIGVEPNAWMRQVAQQRARAAQSAARFIAGDVLELPFADATVDVVRCERVFQHLPDPGHAAREIARVLRPGGRTVVVDADWGTSIVYPGDPDIVARLQMSRQRHMDNPLSGRRLPALLAEAGLEADTDIGSQALVQPPELVGELPLMRLSTGQAVGDGAISAAERDHLLSELSAAAADGTAFVSITLFAVRAVKP